MYHIYYKLIRPIPFILLIALGMVFATQNSTAQNIDGLEFRQIVMHQFDGDDPVLTNIGECMVSFTPGAETGFLQIMGQNVQSGDWSWICQNFFLPSEAWTPEPQQITFRFPLSAVGIQDGEIFEFLAFGFTVGNNPIADPPELSSLNFNEQFPYFFNQMTYGRYLIDPFTPSNVSWYPDWSSPITWIDDYYIDCSTMPNIDLDSTGGSGDLNGCGPAAAANSLTWLNNTNDNINFTPDLRGSFGLLSDLMNRAANARVGDADFIRAKLDFIEMYNLPIKVTYSGSTLSGPISSTSGNTTATTPDTDDAANPSAGWIADQMRDGADVEIGITYPNGAGHWVTGNGCITIGGFTWFDFKHDKTQGSTGGNEQDGSWASTDGTGTVVLTGEGNARVDMVVVEKYVPGYVPVSPNDTLKKYCDWIYRTLPPNSTGTVSYPESNNACMNSTVWELDHSQNPPTWKKSTVWNFNGGKDRSYSNNSNSPVTIAIHNDDYSNQEIPVEIEVASNASTTTQSNESEFAGLSLGGHDGSSSEFGNITTGQVAVTVQDNMSLSSIPQFMNPTGTTSLTLDFPIEIHNEYWNNLDLVIEFVDVTVSGSLTIESSTGTDITVNLDTDDNRLVIDLGAQPLNSDFQVIMVSDGNLEFEFDFIGVASKVKVLDDNDFNMNFDQIDFRYLNNELLDSQTGIVHTDYKPQDDAMFLNIVAYKVGQDPIWIVRNMYMPSDEQTTYNQTPSFKFDLEQMGVAEGEVLTSVTAGWKLSSIPDANMPFIPEYRWNDYEVGDFSVSALGRPIDNDLTPAIDYPTYYPSYVFPFALTDTVWISCNPDDPTSMPNLPLDSSKSPTDWVGCGPASAANSLKWLDKNNDDIDLPPNLKEAYDQLRNLMKYSKEGGVDDIPFIKGKLDIIEAYDLPIKVKYQGVTVNGDVSSTSGNSKAKSHDSSPTAYPTKEWLVNELKDGEDVELGISYPGGQGHWITASGTATINGIPIVFYKHDAEQKDSTGVVTGGSVIAIDSLGRMSLPNEGNAVIEIVVSESFDENHVSVPSSHKFDKYCQWMKRTIPAKSKIDITYPKDNTRCMNATVWRYDRTQSPAKWIRDRVWNFNSNDTRTFVNENDFPLTIAVHNDDRQESEYEINLATTSTQNETSTADNEDKYGGYSLGGTDGSSAEFGTGGFSNMTFTAENGATLFDIPGRFSQSGMRQLTLEHPVNTWNPYWSELELHLTILEVLSSGDLTISVNGELVTTESISGPGELILPLPGISDGETFSLELDAGNELTFEFDNIGIASAVPIEPPTDLQTTFEQIRYEMPDYNIPYSMDAMANLTYTPEGTGKFVNLVGKHIDTDESVWLIRNMYLPSSFWTEYEQNPSYRFDLSALGYAEGESVESIRYAWDMQDDYSVDMPIIPDTYFTDGTFDLLIENAIGRAFAEAPADAETSMWDPQYIYEMLFKDTVYISCNPKDPKSMPNHDLDSSSNTNDINGCGPVSAINSLFWLERNHNEIDIKPEWKAAYKEMANLMNKMKLKGVNDADFVRAKLDFIEMYDLPIKVKFQSYAIDGDMKSSSGNSTAKSNDKDNNSYPTRDWLVSEAKDNEDVEVGFVYPKPLKGGHWVTLSGLSSLDSNTTIYFKHDVEQEKAGGTKTEHSPIKFDSLGRMTLPKKSNGLIDIVVSESFDPNHKSVPNSLSYKKFCEMYKRIIRPHSKITYSYPENQERCYNSTVYVLDRSVKPPVQKKIAVWNFNSGKQRTYVNETDLPVTIIMHNDDNFNSTPPAIAPTADYEEWTITADYEDAADGDVTDESNEAEFGGFSLGGADSSAAEFGDFGKSIVEFEASLGADLSLFPGRIGTNGVEFVRISHKIDPWNKYWDSLEVKIGVHEVFSAGTLQIVSDVCGYNDVLTINGPGEYTFYLGGVNKDANEDFELTLIALQDLEITLDYFAVPTIVDLVGSSVDEFVAENGIKLYRNRPNPFNNTTKIGFDLPQIAKVKLQIFDINGQLIDDIFEGTLANGNHEYTWYSTDINGNLLPSGVYIAKLTVGDDVLSINMILNR